MRKLALITTILSTLFLWGCPYDPPPPTLRIVDTGNDSIFFFLSCEQDICTPRDWIFPELWKVKNGEVVGGGYFDGAPELQKSAPQIESLIIIYGSRRKPRLPCKDLHVFLFDRETVSSHTWEEIKENNLFDKHLVFSEDSLMKMNWRLELSCD